MSEDLRAVDALPKEGAVWELVDIIPRELLSHKVVDPTVFDNLW